MITGEQVKAARELLGWPLQRLAEEAALAQKTLAQFEAGLCQLTVLHAEVLRDVLQAAGVEFTPPGVKLKAKARTIVAGELNASNDE
jgi:transcriptional regulator with XRE-family HTH domain